MASEVVMPKMGYDMTEGTVLRWLKQPGDSVAKGDVLGEIETGKVNIEIEAFDAGIFGAALVEAGTTVPVGTPIALIVAPGEAVPNYPLNGSAAASPPGTAAPASTNHVAAEAPPAPAATSAPTTTVEPAAADGRVRASPLARRMAREAALDLAGVAGSGPGGRVLRDDVVAALALAQQPAAGAVATAPIAPPKVLPAGTVERVPLSRMRQTIARRLTDSWSAAPHIFVTMAIDMGAALALREQVNAALAASGGGKVSVNDLVLKAVGVSLRREPRMNASWDEGARVQHPRAHVGVAVALDDGLITLTIPDADLLPLSQIAGLSAGMSERARTGKLQPEDVATASTFTVTNLGMYGVTQFTAILNPPEAGILAVGAALPTPVVRDGEVVVRPMMNVTLSADHRVVDGATAAQFLVQLRSALENPLVMLV